MRLPARIGKYELVEYLGGGMAQVFRAQDTVLGRTVAVKILSQSGNNEAETRTRFLQEARMASNIQHDNIINVYDFGEENGRPFMVMEFLRGESLRDAIKGGRTGDIDYKLHISLYIARALEFIHLRKIIHRDIKPENIYIDRTGKVKLMDFGIAKAEGLALTRAGFTLGTPYYMAPEQVLGQQVTPLVDVYAFGVLMMELFTGQKPISGESVEKIFQQILHTPMNLDMVRQSGAPPSVVELIRRSTAKAPAERPQGFGVVRGEIERILNMTSTTGQMSPASMSMSAQTAVAQNPGVPSIFSKLPRGMQTPAGMLVVSAVVVALVVLLMILVGKLVSQAL